MIRFDLWRARIQEHTFLFEHTAPKVYSSAVIYLHLIE